MTIIYDMANGSIQTETAKETGRPDEACIASPAAEPRLATVETRDMPHEYDDPQVAVHLIRGLLSPD